VHAYFHEFVQLDAASQLAGHEIVEEGNVDAWGAEVPGASLSLPRAWRGHCAQCSTEHVDALACTFRELDWCIQTGVFKLV
jgi:hypothetical protein